GEGPNSASKEQSEAFDGRGAAARRRGPRGPARSGPHGSVAPLRYRRGRNRTWSTRGAASARGMGTATSLDAALDGGGSGLGQPEPGLQAGEGEWRSSRGGRNGGHLIFFVNRRTPRRTDRQSAGRQIPAATGARGANPQ